MYLGRYILTWMIYTTHTTLFVQEIVMADYPLRYFIGWACALPYHFVAARALFDEDYGSFRIDKRVYHGGKIGQYNIVLALFLNFHFDDDHGYIPGGSYVHHKGTKLNANILDDMGKYFRNLKLIIQAMVGGAVPVYTDVNEQASVVLGDVVVVLDRPTYAPHEMSGGCSENDQNAMKTRETNLDIE